MPSYPYHPALTGLRLDAAVEATAESRTPLIEGLLYERSVLLMSADAGVGKSTIVANVIAQASLGLPVFQTLHVPRPLLCYYIPFERGSEEIRERFKHIREAIPYNSQNIRVFDNTEFATPNLYDPNDQAFLLDSIQRDCPERAPDIVFYDPIYQAVAGGLSNEDRVSLFIRFNVKLMAHFRCATWLNHHTGKSIYSASGAPIEKDDPYYGSSYLKNHCTGSYYLKKNPEGDGTLMLRKKDNLDLLLKKITLYYEPETYTSYIKDDLAGMSAADRLRVILRQFKSEKKTFTFRQLEGCVNGVTTSYLRRLIYTPPFKDFLKARKKLGEANLYTVEGDI